MINLMFEFTGDSADCTDMTMLDYVIIELVMLLIALT